MKTRFFQLLISAIILSFLLTGCGAASLPVSARPPLKVAWTLWPGWYPILIAQQQGFFSKHGVNVDPVRYDNYEGVYPDMASGKLDGALSGLYDLFVPASVSPMKVVMVTDDSNGAEGLIAVAGINSAADLAHKRIGVSPGSIGEFFTMSLLLKNGLSGADVTLLNVDAETVPHQLPSQLDAGYTWQPHLSEAMANNNHILSSSADVPGLIPDVVAFQATVVQQRPEDVRAFVAAWFDAVAWWQANPSAGNDLIAKATAQKSSDISLDGVKIFSQVDNLKAFSQGNDTTSLFFTGKEQLDYLVSISAFNKTPDLNFMLDPSYLK